MSKIFKSLLRIKRHLCFHHWHFYSIYEPHLRLYPPRNARTYIKVVKVVSYEQIIRPDFPAYKETDQDQTIYSYATELTTRLKAMPLLSLSNLKGISNSLLSKENSKVVSTLSSELLSYTERNNIKEDDELFNSLLFSYAFATLPQYKKVFLHYIFDCSHLLSPEEIGILPPIVVSTITKVKHWNSDLLSDLLNYFAFISSSSFKLTLLYEYVVAKNINLSSKGWNAFFNHFEIDNDVKILQLYENLKRTGKLDLFSYRSLSKYYIKNHHSAITELLKEIIHEFGNLDVYFLFDIYRTALHTKKFDLATTFLKMCKLSPLFGDQFGSKLEMKTFSILLIFNNNEEILHFLSIYFNMPYSCSDSKKKLPIRLPYYVENFGILSRLCFKLGYYYFSVLFQCIPKDADSRDYIIHMIPVYYKIKAPNFRYYFIQKIFEKFDIPSFDSSRRTEKPHTFSQALHSIDPEMARLFQYIEDLNIDYDSFSMYKIVSEFIVTKNQRMILSLLQISSKNNSLHLFLLPERNVLVYLLNMLLRMNEWKLFLSLIEQVPAYKCHEFLGASDSLVFIFKNLNELKKTISLSPHIYPDYTLLLDLLNFNIKNKIQEENSTITSQTRKVFWSNKFKFVGDIRNNINAFKSLNISAEIKEHILKAIEIPPLLENYKKIC